QSVAPPKSKRAGIAAGQAKPPSMTMADGYAQYPPALSPPPQGPPEHAATRQAKRARRSRCPMSARLTRALAPAKLRAQVGVAIRCHASTTERRRGSGGADRASA